MSNILKFDFKLTYLGYLNRLDLEAVLNINYRDVQGYKSTYKLILELWILNLWHHRNVRDQRARWEEDRSLRRSV